MSVLVSKLVSTALAVLLSMAFGYLPLLLALKWTIVHPKDPEYDKSKGRNVSLSFLLNFGGGVLIANCFCHWLPEVREGIEHEELDTDLPLAEIIMCSGFFFICLLEEVIHQLAHKMSLSADFPCLRQDPGQRTNQGHDPSPNENDQALMQNRKEDILLSSIRTFFVVFALSFHSVIEGIALALESESSGVWMNFGALASHKFIIAFSVGAELISVKATKLQYFISIGVFSIAPAIGVAIGILIVGEEANVHTFAIQILQGIGIGTIVYVVFFEVFPKATEIGAFAFTHVIAMILGFGVFMPSLLFHTHKDAPQKPEDLLIQ